MSWNPFKTKLSRSSTLVCKYCGSDKYYFKKNAIDTQFYVCGECHVQCRESDIGPYSSTPFIKKNNYWLMVANKLNILGKKI